MIVNEALKRELKKEIVKAGICNAESYKEKRLQEMIILGAVNILSQLSVEDKYKQHIFLRLACKNITTKACNLKKLGCNTYIPLVTNTGKPASYVEEAIIGADINLPSELKPYNINGSYIFD